MKFDSTPYLIYFLKEKLGIPDEYSDYCVGILNGFVIQPGSIKHDEDNKLLSLSATLPNNELNVSKLIISDTDIYLRLRVRDAIINVRCGIYSQIVRLSMIIDNKENECSGIYYYDSHVLNPKELNYYGLLSYYDSETLRVINDAYLLDFIRSGLNLSDVIGAEQKKINELGFIPDTVEWNNSNLLKKGNSILDIARLINDQFVNFNYDTVMNKLSNFSKETQAEIGPVKRR